ncbi:MAG: hypothetical protein JNK73_12915 [Bacteroidia bacterium]|nr:hypothetical protein [Bacteroidia bacterium]
MAALIKKVSVSFLFPAGSSPCLFILCILFCSGEVVSQQDSSLVLSSDSADYGNIPFIHLSNKETEGTGAEQDAPALLQSGRDVFLQFSVFQFAAGRFRMRGYPSKYQSVLFNGINVNNLETGYTVWNQWGGLNDISRYAENQFGVISSRYTFSGLGGYVHIDSKATSFRKGTRLSYSFGNRLFQQRIMLTHSTGMLQNGWAFTASASWRYGDEVYIPGTYYNSKAFFISVDKRLNANQLLNFTALSANTEQGRASAEQMEVFALSGNNYYNSNWGLQNGKVRNASVSKGNKPLLILNHQFQLNKTSRLNSMLFYTFGKSGSSALNWNDAPNPRPNYYRYLPSYFYSQGDTASGDEIKALWADDINTSQINWDKMIQMNQQNVYALPGEGVVNNQTRARYILENRIENLKNLGLNTVYSGRFDKLFISAGCNANLYRNRKYKEMEDLLGASYWLDYDQFADNLGVSSDFQQNDIEHPDKKIYQGDRFGYDYSINMNRAEVWFQNEYSFRQLELYSGISFSGQQVWREGFVANGKFPNSSKGTSEKAGFFNYGFKAGVTYKISGRHFVSANVLVQTRAPEVNSVFISPRTRNDVVSQLENEQLMSGDVSYRIRYPGLNIRLSGYYTIIKNQTWLRSYWHDEYNNTVNLIMKGLDQSFTGLELGLEKTLFTQHQLQLALAYGQFLYASRPTLEAWQDNNNVQLYSNRTSYLENYRVGGTPQTVLGLGYRYTSRQHWYAGLYFNGFYKIYTDLNPERRTAEAVDKYLSSEEKYYQAILKQEQLPSYFILNANTGKSFRVQRKHYLNITAVVYNLLNNKNNISTGFEQLRWDKNDVTRFANKYYYMQGTTFMLNMSFTFN